MNRFICLDWDEQFLLSLQVINFRFFFTYFDDNNIRDIYLLVIYINIFIFFWRKTILRAEEHQGYTLLDNLYCDTQVECKIESFGVHKKIGSNSSIY